MSLKWKVRNELVKRSRLMKRIIDSAAFRKNRKRYEKQAANPIKENAVVFMSFMGNKYADSPRAIYEYMLSSAEYDNYEFYWFFKKPEKYKFLENNSRTKVYKYNSDDHYRYYATAKYWVTNSRVPDVIPVRKEQVYLQCWHGTPLKRLGFDVKVGGANAKYTPADVSRQYEIDAMKYTYMTSPSRFCTEKFISAFGLDRHNKEDIIIEKGYPRNDFLSNHTEEDVNRIKKELGILENKKVILYAPTWRDNQFYGKGKYKFTLAMDLERMRKEFGKDSVILLRTHYYIADSLDLTGLEDFVYNGSTYNDVSRLYLASDICITDYSSVFFDYANLRRPMLFFAYDYEDYKDEIRGMYFDMNTELPGPILQTNDELVDALHHIDVISEKYKERYDRFYDKFCHVDDGHAAKRAIDIVFEGAKPTFAETEE